MFKHNRYTYSFALACWLASSKAFADAAIKKLIIKDCAQAKTALPQLSPADRVDFVKFISLLLKQHPAPAHEIVIDASQVHKKINPFDSPFDEGSSGDLLRHFDPSRETDAKRCALEVLDLLGGEAFGAIPSIIELSSDKATPQLVRDRLADTMLRITAAAVKNTEYVPDQAVIKVAVEGLSQPYQAFSENFLIELGARGIQPLLVEMRKPDQQRRVVIGDLLLRIDSEGTFIGPGVAELLQSGDDGLRGQAVALLGRMPGYIEKSIPLLVGAFTDLSPDVRDRAVESLKGFPKEVWQRYGKVSDVIVPAIRYLRILPPEKRASITQLLQLLLPLSATSEEPLLDLIEKGDEDLKIRCLQLLEAAPALSDRGFEAVSKLVFLPNEGVSTQAVSTLSTQTSRKDKVLEVFFQTLKKKDPNRLQTGSYERIVARGIVSLDAVGNAKKFGPLLLPALPRGTASVDDPVATFFTALGPDAIPLLLPLVKEKGGDRVVTAVKILSATSAKDPRVVTQLIALLKESEGPLSLAVQEGLRASGPAATPMLRKLLKSPAPKVKFAAAKLLAQQGIGDTTVQTALFEGLLAEDCMAKGDLLNLISKLQGSVSQQLTGPLIQCGRMGVLSPEQLVQSLVNLKPLSQDTQLHLLDLLRDDQADRTLKLKILEASDILDLPDVDVGAILTAMLQSQDNALRYAALGVVRTMGDKAKIIAPKLVEIVDASTLEPLLQHEAVLSIIQIDPSLYDYVSFFISELKGDRADWALRSLRRLKMPELQLVLQKAIDSLSVESRVPVIRLIGELPPEQGKVFVPKLVPLLNSRIASLRYAAIVTLLKIAPEVPEIIPAFRLELIDSQRDELIRETFPASLKPVLESMLPGAATRVEQLGIQELLKKF